MQSGSSVREAFADTGLLDWDGLSVIGVTPFGLFSSCAGEARFDVAVTTLVAATGLEAPVVIHLGIDRLSESEKDIRLAEGERGDLRRDHKRSGTNPAAHRQSSRV
jgi:hypothetical protein